MSACKKIDETGKLVPITAADCHGSGPAPSPPPPSPTPPPPLNWDGVTADFFVLQFHFENSGPNTLDSFVHQMYQLPVIFNTSNTTLLPLAVVWRTIAPAYRGNTSKIAPGQYPSLAQNIAALRSLSRLYAAAVPRQKLRLVYYPDIETSYAEFWGLGKQEQNAIKRDKTLAVSMYMPDDFVRWNDALRAAAIADKGDMVLFDEIILETYGAPMKPATHADQQPTLTLLRANPLLEGVRLSLTPDFSDLEGKCRDGVKDDCFAFIRPPGRNASEYGRYYTQIYNIYSQTERFKRNNAALTDVTPYVHICARARALSLFHPCSRLYLCSSFHPPLPSLSPPPPLDLPLSLSFLHYRFFLCVVPLSWDVEKSLGGKCATHTTKSKCKNKCCQWSSVPGVDLCFPVQSKKCLVPKKGLCNSDRYEGCNPPPGGSIYDAATSPTNASIHIGEIVADRFVTVRDSRVGVYATCAQCCITATAAAAIFRQS